MRADGAPSRRQRACRSADHDHASFQPALAMQLLDHNLARLGIDGPNQMDGDFPVFELASATALPFGAGPFFRLQRASQGDEQGRPRPISGTGEPTQGEKDTAFSARQSQAAVRGPSATRRPCPCR